MSEQPKRRLQLWPLWIALLTVLLDQVSKYFVILYLKPVGVAPIIGDALRLIYTENTGISFGRLQGMSTWITILGATLVVGLLIGYRWLLTSSRWANLALGCIIGGATGNLIDRLITSTQVGLANSYVVDFISVSIWPVFNVADSAITCGGIAYAVYLLFFHGRPRKKAKEGAQPHLGPL